MIELVFEGRPVPWARPARGKRGGKTPAKQLEHRRALAKALQFSEGVRAIEGPATLKVHFDYESSETRIQIAEAAGDYRGAETKGFGLANRADVDNLVKQVMEAAELAGLVKDDVQFVSIDALKIG